MSGKIGNMMIGLNARISKTCGRARGVRFFFLTGKLDAYGGDQKRDQSKMLTNIARKYVGYR